MKLLQLVFGIVTAAAALPQPAGAQAQPVKPLVITAHNVTSDSVSGRAHDAVARPGDVIRYVLVFTNVTSGAVKNVQFVDPLPRGMVYVLGSARADLPVRVEYSIDGGKGYSARPVVQTVAAGKTVEQPVPPAQYTHIRWTVVGSLAPGAQVTAEFRAQVGGAPGEAK
jgi:uncharacterized repeat protein (TIGR01451 family)